MSTKSVCIITGGSSGIGLECARLLGDYKVIITGRTKSKLEIAKDILIKDNIDAEYITCDISDIDDVIALFEFASSFGEIKAVINSAGLSPHMGDDETILRVNAIGTINMNNTFYEYVNSGGCIIDVSSISAYIMPRIVIPKHIYKYAFIDENKFLNKLNRNIKLYPKKLRSSIAYGVSKNFVIYYAKKDSMRYAKKNARCLSITPGNFNTPMGEIEKEEAEKYTNNSALKRLGEPKEIAEVIAFCISSKASYLTGTDIICDGGVVGNL